MFSVLISCRLSGGDGQHSLACYVSVWPETMWEREHSPRFHCHGTLPQTTGAAVQGTRARAMGEAFPCVAPPCRARRPMEVLMPLVEFCLKLTNSKMNQTAKGQPPGKKGQPLCFHTGHFTLPDCLPPLIPCVLFPSQSWRDFPWHLNWKEWLQPIHQKNVAENWIWLLGKRGSLII